MATESPNEQREPFVESEEKDVKFEGTPKNTLLEALGIELTEVTPDRVVATMPVDSRTHQPYGLLHGGASVALAETVASVGTAACIDLEKQYAVGLEINANHLRSKTEGIVTAIATPIFKGRTTMVWDIRIVDEADKLLCISRCTVAVRDQQA